TRGRTVRSAGSCAELQYRVRVLPIVRHASIGSTINAVIASGIAVPHATPMIPYRRARKILHRRFAAPSAKRIFASALCWPTPYAELMAGVNTVAMDPTTSDE